MYTLKNIDHLFQGLSLSQEKFLVQIRVFESKIMVSPVKPLSILFIAFMMGAKIWIREFTSASLDEVITSNHMTTRSMTRTLC